MKRTKMPITDSRQPCETSDNSLNLKTCDLLQLYSFYSQDEYELIRALQSYTKFFTSIILATVGGAILVLEKVKDTRMAGLGFVIGGILTIGVSIVAYHAARSNYRRQLESIVKRFKIECILNLDKDARFFNKKYMPSEALLLTRYLNSFAPYIKGNSSEFVSQKLKQGFMKVLSGFYTLTGMLGIVIIVIGIMAMSK